MVMRYHWGLAVGHIHGHGLSSQPHAQVEEGIVQDEPYIHEDHDGESSHWQQGVSSDDLLAPPRNEREGDELSDDNKSLSDADFSDPNSTDDDSDGAEEDDSADVELLLELDDMYGGGSHEDFTSFD
jgi:hypothetical protein